MKTEAKIKNMGKKQNIVFKISTVFCCLLLYASAAYGHKVYLFAWAEDDRIYTESYLSGNKKVQDGILTVFDSEGNELLKGKTDENGEFSFKIPEIADLRIVLEASMGHGAEYLFKKSEFSAGQAPASEVASDPDTGKKPEAPLQVTTDHDQLRKEFEAALDARLKPVMRELAKLKEDKGPGITEVIGGIGYILGIMGIVAYMRSRKNQGAGCKAQGTGENQDMKS
ncbi:hypothetical protein ACFL6W_07085 [Thermodesulfobacteriota bacterium]